MRIETRELNQCHKDRLSLLLVLSLFRGSFLQVLRFFSLLQKPAFPNFSEIRIENSQLGLLWLLVLRNYYNFKSNHDDIQIGPEYSSPGFRQYTLYNSESIANTVDPPNVVLHDKDARAVIPLQTASYHRASLIILHN